MIFNTDERRKVGIGLIASGFMGRCQANAFASVAGLFDVPVGLFARDDRLGLHPLAPDLVVLRTRARRPSK